MTTPEAYLGGHFVNHLTKPTPFDWSGGLTLTASSVAEQNFEVAGADVGNAPSGWVGNFSVGRLHVVAGGRVRFVNAFANQVGLGCNEALYVDTLVLDANATVTADNCRVYVRHITRGANVTLAVSGCGAWRISYGLGDMNCDGSLDFRDINPFVLALSDRTGYLTKYPNCDVMSADCNQDGYVDFKDINAFVALLTSTLR